MHSGGDRARRGAETLGWSGELLTATLLGVPTTAVVRIDQRAHHARQQAGQAPVLDLDVLSVWEWPDWTGPRAPEVVRLAGTLHADRSWERALGGAARLRSFGAAAILVDGEPSEDCVQGCARRGVGVVAEDGRLVVPAAIGRAMRATRHTLDRWLEEDLYRQWLQQTDQEATQA